MNSKSDYKALWDKLKRKLDYSHENAHPRFKIMHESPTITIKEVLNMMEEMEITKKYEKILHKR